jgi:hypothetical protein
MSPKGSTLGRLADMTTPISRRLFGPETNRRTEEAVAREGLDIVDVRARGIWREMGCRPAPEGSAHEDRRSSW